MIVDERLCKELTITTTGTSMNIRLKPSNGGYVQSFGITFNPTSNCQLASANGIGPVIKGLNKYHLRDLFINIRNHNSKRILLLDLNRTYVEHILNCLPEGAILMNTPYTSTNYHLMNIVLVRLSSIRQLQLPKIK